MPRRAAAAAILLGLLWYAALGFRQPDRPGLNYEECAFAPPLIGGPRFEAHPTPDLKSLLMKPFLSRAGNSASAIRFPLVAVGLLGIALSALFAWRHLGRREAALFALLAALDPSVLHHVREDYARAALSFPLRAAVLLACFSFLRGGKKRALVAAGFLAGLGVWNQADFALFVAALIITLAIWQRGVFRWWPAALAFFIGASPALVFWISQRDLVALSLHAPPVSMLSLGYKLAAIYDTLRAHYPTYTFLGAGSITPPHTLLPEVLLAGLCLMIWLRRRGAMTSVNRALPLLATLFGVHALLLFFVPQTFGSHHFFALAPTAHLLAAALVFHFLDHVFASATARRIATPLLLAPILITSLISSIGAERLLDKRGGDGPWSPAITKLAEALRGRSDLNMVFLDGGMTTQLITRNGAFPQEEIFRSFVAPPPPAQVVQHLDSLLADARVVFITHEPKRVMFTQVTRTFDERLRALGLERCFAEGIADNRGKIQYEMFAVCKKTLP